jgi:DNA-binding MarR family transcriptional regulator
MSNKTLSPDGAAVERRRPRRADSLGGAAIGAHLRRLSDRIDRDANQVYVQLGIAFEQRWMGMLDLLDRSGPMSVKDIATDLRISHPSVSQTRASLLAAGLVAERDDPADGRRRTLRLSANGQALVEKLRPVWSALEQTGRTLNREAGDVVAALAQLEDALDRASIAARTAELLDARAPR